MPAEVETLMYARDVPWHGLGHKVEGLQTAADAIVAAGLDWEVVQRPIYIREIGDKKGKIVKVDGKVANVRVSDSRPLGIVTPSYKVVQNVTLFEMFDEIVKSGDAKYETTGSLLDGKVVFISMEMPKDILVGGEKYEGYLLGVSSHDGSFATRGAVSMIRTVCKNTLDASLAAAKSEFRLRHTLNVMDRVDDARKALGLTFKYIETFEATAEKLLLRKVTKAEVLRTITQVFPMKDVNPLKLNADELRRVVLADVGVPAAKALSTYETSPNLANIRGTAWGLYNGVAEYLDYGQFYRSREGSALENRAKNLMLNGPASQKKQKTLEILLRSN